MAKVLNFFEKVFKSFKCAHQNPRDKYLSQSTDLADLETRMKEMRHASPQYKYRYWI